VRRFIERFYMHWPAGPEENKRRTPLVDKADVQIDVTSKVTEAQNDASEPRNQTKKKFVKPEISVPVDVLEATTFFQQLTSGPTNP
jgi:hypothetical protein